MEKTGKAEEVFYHVVTEMVVMIEGVQCEEEGAQQEEKQKYIAEMKGDLETDKERIREYRRYLTRTIKGLAGPGSQAQCHRGAEGPISIRWRDRCDFHPGTIPEEITKLEWRTWRY